MNVDSIIVGRGTILEWISDIYGQLLVTWEIVLRCGYFPCCQGCNIKNKFKKSGTLL